MLPKGTSLKKNRKKKVKWMIKLSNKKILSNNDII